jgi:putative hydrolase of the HAD superfamily
MHGYSINAQSWEAASNFVGMIDYPKYGYLDRFSYLKQVLKRLDMEIKDELLEKPARLYTRRNSYSLFHDTPSAVRDAKQLRLNTAIVTTIPEYVFASALRPIRAFFDTIMTGRKTECEKSNPLMHKRTLETLEVRPDQAVIIGDDLLVDIKIPRKLGMRIILLDRSSNIETKPREADEKTATLTEALSIIEGWQKP